MKKAAVIMTALTLAAAFLTGCQDPVSDTGSDTGGVRFQAAIDGAQSRVVAAAWSKGDAIGISMLRSGGSDPVGSASNRKFVTQDAKNFDPADGQKISVSEKADFVAYYPYASPMTGFTYPVDVSDQTNQEAIDLMTAKAERVEPNTNQVSLTFQHRLSAVGLTVKPGDGVSVNDLANVEAEISGQIVRGTYDVKANTFSPSAAAGDLNKSLKFKMSADMSGGAKSGEAVILPASGGTNRTMIIVLHTGDAKVTFTKSIPNNYAFSPGVRHQFPLKLSRDPASSTGYKAEGGFAGTTEPEETLTGEETSGGTTPNPNPNPTPTPTPISKYIVNPIATPVGGKGYEYKGKYTDNNFDCWLLYLGKIVNVPMDHATSDYYYADRDETITFNWSHSTEEGFADTISETATKTINTTHETSDTLKIEVGIEGKVEVPGVASIKESLKESLEETFKNSTTTSISSTTAKTAQQYTTWTNQEGVSKPQNLYKDSDPEGYYRMSLFAQCDVYVTLLQSRDDKKVYYKYEVMPNKDTYNRRLEYSPPDNGDFSKDIPQLPFDLDWVKNPEFVSSGPVTNITNIDSSIGIGKPQYNYEALQTGYITVTLVGGGGGGSGAVAVRDYSNSQESRAISGSGAQGDDTKLYVRKKITDTLPSANRTATGGAGGTGRDKTTNGWTGAFGIGDHEGYDKQDGEDGRTAQPTGPFTIQVYKGDIITIEVGSGGAANNDKGGKDGGDDAAKSNTASGTTGTAGATKTRSGTYAYASSGGAGASGGSKDGADSSAASSASGVSGGKGKGAGGKGGKAVTSGNVYASGGGGGAAGGFTLHSDKVELLERL
jgi:hypothetical protein